MFRFSSRRGIAAGNESRVLILADIITGKLPDPASGTRAARTRASLSKVHRANRITMGAIAAVVPSDLRSVIRVVGYTRSTLRSDRALGPLL